MDIDDSANLDENKYGRCCCSAERNCGPFQKHGFIDEMFHITEVQSKH